MATHAATVRWAALALVGSLAVVLIACSVEPAPTSTPTRSPGEIFAGAPADLQSYRYTVALRATADLIDTSAAPTGLDAANLVLHIQIAGERVNPDRERTVSLTDIGITEVERESVVIGQRIWTRLRGGPWRESPPLLEPQDFIGQDVALSPAVLMAPESPDVLDRIVAGLRTLPYAYEEVNGYQTRHWSLDHDQVMTIFSEGDSTLPGLQTPDEIRLKWWMDVETGIVVRMILEAASETNPEAFHIEINLFDLETDDIKIDPPRGALGSR